jgi:hypothetical protein|tara:strand:+ start:68 stop:445 length:378 start_codon:yes stop_codon:yes gene_type:complete
VELIVQEDEDGIKGVYSIDGCLGLTKSMPFVYKFAPVYIEKPTRTSIQFREKHFEDKIGRFINHNCNPNTRVLPLNGTGDIVLVPTRAIAKNEEITIDYNRTEKKLSHPFECDCHGRLIQGLSPV